jgi:predicted transcriptional regulator/transcriptional regulator with XRE-family HTH domain
MSKPLIGRTVRRLRLERGLAQQALATRLGISASYLNLIEHDQRAVTASLLIKLSQMLGVDLAALSGQAERQIEVGLREVFADRLMGAEPVPEEEIAAVAGQAPNAARAVLALYRAWRVAREDAGGIALPSGRRILLPHEEARDAFHEFANYVAALEEAAESIGAELAAPPVELETALIARLRARHHLAVRVGPTDATRRRFDPQTGHLLLSERLSPSSRAFQLAFQVALMELRDVVEARLAELAPSSPEAASLIRLGLLNYAAAALMMPYVAFHEAASTLRHDLGTLAARFCASFEQVCHRLSSLQRPGLSGVPFFFLRVDPAGNVSKRFSAAGFPFARFGGSCPRWVVHNAFATPGEIRVQVAALPDGATFLCMARTVRSQTGWGEPDAVHVVAIGCDIAHAPEIVHADGIDIDHATVGIGLSCRLCDRQSCRSRAFPPLEHRLTVDPLNILGSPYRFDK